MSLKANLKKLIEIQSVSGFEADLAKEVKTLFEKYTDDIKIDPLQSVIGVKKSKNPKGSVMLEAHIDEIGLMVTKIDDDGFLYFTSVGGIDARILPANRVKVHGKKVLTGVIGAKPPHLLQEGEMSKTIPMDKLFIDVGLNKKECEKVVSVGDVVTFYPDFKILSKDYIATKSQDDKMSVAILLDVLEKLKDTNLNFDLYVVLSSQEEVGLRGAKCAAYSVDPTFAIAIDVCHATTPDAKEGTFKAGSGTVITKGPNLHKNLTNNIIKVLDKNKIKYNIEACGGQTGTDAWVIQTSKNAIPVALFSIPLKYMHTPYEVVNIKDANMTSKAIVKFLTSLESAGDALC